MEEKLTQEEIRNAMRLLLGTDRMHRTITENAVQSLGLHRTQHMMMMYLLHNENTSSQKALSEAFRISPAAVTNSLQKLEKNGWVTRTTSETDNRYHRIRLTAAGKELLQKTCQQFAQADEKAFSGISREELAVFTACLTKMRQNLEPEAHSIAEAGNRKDEKA